VIVFSAKRVLVAIATVESVEILAFNDEKLATNSSLNPVILISLLEVTLHPGTEGSATIVKKLLGNIRL
jgi:hypothetical protein